MALQIAMTFKGIVVPSAYVTVSLPQISADKTKVSFVVQYSNSPSDEVFNSVAQQSTYSLTGTNPFEQAYTYLKTLPEFASATNV